MSQSQIDMSRKLCMSLIQITGILVLGYITLKLLKRGETVNCQAPDENKNLTEGSICKLNSFKKTRCRSKRNKKKIGHSKEVMKVKKLKPNFFLGFQISDTGIHQKVKNIQEIIIKKNPKLEPALINTSTLHLTLAVTHLVNEEDIRKLKEKLDAWANNNIESYFKDPIILNFTGIKTFNNVVAYVDIEQCESYSKVYALSKAMKDVISAAGFTAEEKDFVPHLTILKLSKDFKLLKSKKEFKDDFDTLNKCTDHFGTQELKNIQLLSMNEPKDDNGYYKCFHQIDTKNKSELLPDQCIDVNPNVNVEKHIQESSF